MTTSYEVIWASTAKDDLRSIVEYLHAESPPAARNTLEKITTAAANLYTFPNRGRIVPELQTQGITLYRELIITPWRLIYRVSKNQVLVLAVIDARRNVEDLLLDKFVRTQ